MKREDFVISGSDGRDILLDVTYAQEFEGAQKNNLIFAHGFKGFKDWGHFGLIASEIASYGINVVKFSFSHGGTTTENPVDFADLDAFGNNTISKECFDLKCVIDWVSGHLPGAELSLLGHSRGGAIVLLTGIDDSRVGKIITWSSISGFERYADGSFVEAWRKDGVRFFPNARTGQNMPMYFSFYEDYISNKAAFDVCKKLAVSNKPCLFVHGAEDEAVPLSDAFELHAVSEPSLLSIVPAAGHTFGGAHPWIQEDLPSPTRSALKHTVAFIGPYQKV